jgi:hypothetical protein
MRAPDQICLNGRSCFGTPPNTERDPRPLQGSKSLLRHLGRRPLPLSRFLPAALCVASTLEVQPLRLEMAADVQFIMHYDGSEPALLSIKIAVLRVPRQGSSLAPRLDNA